MKSEDVGAEYRALIGYVHDTLKNQKTRFPGYDEKAGYEVAGFVWFQGYNDQFDEVARKEYGKNLVCLINDLLEQFKALRIKVVVGVMGVNGVTNEDPTDEKSVAMWERVLEKLEVETMSPPEKPRPKAAEWVAVARWIQDTRQKAGKSFALKSKPRWCPRAELV